MMVTPSGRLGWIRRCVWAYAEPANIIKLNRQSSVVCKYKHLSFSLMIALLETRLGTHRFQRAGIAMRPIGFNQSIGQVRTLPCSNAEGYAYPGVFSLFRADKKVR